MNYMKQISTTNSVWCPWGQGPAKLMNSVTSETHGSSAAAPWLQVEHSQRCLGRSQSTSQAPQHRGAFCYRPAIKLLLQHLPL